MTSLSIGKQRFLIFKYLISSYQAKVNKLLVGSEQRKLRRIPYKYNVYNTVLIILIFILLYKMKGVVTVNFKTEIYTLSPCQLVIL